MTGYPLYENVGEVVQLIEPDAYATDVPCSDNDSGVPVQDAQGILFVLAVGELPTSTNKGTVTVTLKYASDGGYNGSDAGQDSDVWHCTDAAFAEVDSDGENEVYLLDLDLGAKALMDEQGKLYADAQTEGDANDFTLIAIPYGMTYNPSTNENTVVYADYST